MLEIQVPGSKSYTQRALVISALAKGKSELVYPLDCEDTAYLVEALVKMGVKIERTPRSWIITPPESLKIPTEEIYLGNAGTAVRFLMAFSAILDGKLQLDGNKAMRGRPHSGLIEALRGLGISPQFDRQNYLPGSITGPARPDAHAVELDGSLSSQFLSALLMVAPQLPKGLKISISGELVSMPYVDMTLQAMAAFGINVVNESTREFFVAPANYKGCRYTIEADASSAAFVHAAGILTNRAARIPNLDLNSLQGDSVFSKMIPNLRSHEDLVLNLGQAPDLVPPLVGVAIFRNAKTLVTHIAHLKNKETDRIAVLSTELTKLGANIRSGADFIEVTPSPLSGNVTLDPQGDHRMAMTFALAGLRLPGIAITDKLCVSKSFPNFFEILERFL